MNKVTKLLLIAYGRERYIPGFSDIVGICCNAGAKKEVKEHSQSWEFFSGSKTFPVPGGADAYWEHFTLYEGEYGDLRRDLARHVAKCLLREQTFFRRVLAWLA